MWNWNRIINVLMSWIMHMWLKNLYENLLVNVKCKRTCVFVALKTCYNRNRNIMTKNVLELNFMCVHAKIVWFCWIQRTNCVIGSESVFTAKFVLSAANQCSLLNLCCRQRSGCSLPYFVVRSESGVRCQICVVRSESGVCCRICVVRSESGVRYRICVRCRSVLSAAIQVFAAESVWSAANQVFAAELCCPRWIRCSLSNYVVRSESGVHCRIVLSVVKQVFYQIMLSAMNQVFAAEFVLSTANQVFTTELCIPQRIRCSLPNLCYP